MSSVAPEPITPAERLARIRRIRRVARRFGYVGQIEYRHVYSNSGGAQFGLGRTRQRDLLIVYAEAFDRDADPNDFSLEAVIAHERGHQIVARNRNLQEFLIEKVAPATEEILASLLGSLLVTEASDKQALVLKALDEVLQCGIPPGEAIELVTELRGLLEEQI
jgi:hypothetical protein